uniref:Late transcription factor VLTF3-like protein n=1 Tax=viral metagenome TaxID=1070528 RepID=A0A6C0LYD9_9ZZZZ
MSLFKEKKLKHSTPKTKFRVTIDAKHKSAMENFKNEKISLKELESKLNTLNYKYQILSKKKTIELSDMELEKKLSIREDISALKQKILLIEKNTDANKYLLNTSNILFQYYEKNEGFQAIKQTNSDKKSVLDFFSPKKEKKIEDDIKKDKNKYNKGEILDKYLEYVEKDYIINRKKKINLEFCSRCNVERIFSKSEGIYICPNCGNQEKILIDSDKPSYKEPPREISYFAYKRINHFNEWLAQFQAKESTDIPKNVYDMIKVELKKEKYIDIKNLKKNKIRNILKKLGLNKYYEHVPHIINRLSGKPAPIIDRETEEKLRMMFKEIQAPWIKHCPNKRSNFLSYSYVLYKCLQLLEMDHFLPYFSLLKSREKLAEQDKIWKDICQDLRWEYIKTI